tara:strand:+ start:11007 stop:14720 length:3714 start_codon:yes stop_codon:yes gene_type:complete
MSIFTQTFAKFVTDQLTDRESILSIGETLDSSRIGKPKKKYPAGAFYTNTVERQCYLRMSSGVDLNKEGERNILKKGSLIEKEWKGEYLARNWVLEGGVPVPGFVTDENLTTLNEKRGKENETRKKQGLKELDSFEVGDQFRQAQRGGFTNQPNRSYGDPATRSDQSIDEDGYGIVPMPGIIDANIKTKSAYGSLREAKVEFICHNRRQLEVLELLYMRPGYTVLLEWGWVPHIKRIKGGAIKSSDFFPLEEFWDGSMDYGDLNTLIYLKREEAQGNYDAMLGYVKNFEIKVREDGGYDCSTTLIAMGEILEGIKGKRNFPPFKSGEDEESKVYDNFEVYLMACQQYCTALTDKNDAAKRGTLKRWWQSGMGKTSNYYALNANDPWRHDVSSKFSEAFNELNAVLDVYSMGTEHETVEEEAEFTWDEKWYANISSVAIYQWAKSKIVGSGTTMKNKSLLDHFLIHKTEPLGLRGSSEPSDLNEAQDHYIRWDLMVEILNHFVIEDNGDNKKLCELSYVNETQESSADSGVYLEYSNYQFNPAVKIPLATKFGTGEVDLTSLMDISVNPKFLLPHQIAASSGEGTRDVLILGKKKFAKNGFDVNGKPQNTIAARERAIGLVYISVDHLLETYRSMRYSGTGDNEKFSLLKFIKKIWEEDITGACAGTHNFILQCPNNIGRIIDVQYQGGLKPEDLYQVKIQNKNSIVRDFNFNTTIDKKLSSTIAIAAQAPKSISSLDQLSFAAFNKNISNRFVNVEMDADKAKEYRIKLEKDVNKLAYDLYIYKQSIVDKKNAQDTTDESSKAGSISITNAVNKLQSLESKVIELGMTYPLVQHREDPNLINIPPEEGSIEALANNQDNYPRPHDFAGQRRPDANVSKSTIIPLKFNAQLDGIGGLIIGNVFRVEKEKLPKGYQGDDIAFALFGINHKINNGQDWVTEISGQLLLLNHSDLGKDQINTQSYTNSELLSHGMDSYAGLIEGRMPIFVDQNNIFSGGRGPNAQKLVDFCDNVYPVKLFDPSNTTGDEIWAADRLDGFLTEKVGSSDGTDPLPQIDSNGDLAADFTAVCRQLFRKLKDMSNSPRHDSSLFNKKDNFHIMITGGNDKFHANSNSRHKIGKALDFVIVPHENATTSPNESVIMLFDNLLTKFMAANNGRFTYINEYTDPTKNASGDHFHISWNALANGVGGVEPAAKAKYQEAITKHPNWTWEGTGEEQKMTGGGSKDYLFDVEFLYEEVQA